MNFKQIALVIFLLLLAAIILPNLRSLYEGIFFYLRDTVTSAAISPNPIRRDGRYASLYDLVSLRNAERRAYLTRQLNAMGVSLVEIPIPDSQQTNLFVRFNANGEQIILSAHYDKIFDEPGYHGASDNTAAVSVLLASIKELVQRSYRGNATFLFTGEEERGLRGSQAFVAFARENNIAIKENLNFDNLGRGKLGLRPSAEIPGIVFAFPFLGEYTYDGQRLQPSSLYPLIPARLIQNILRAQSETTVYERFTARSDSNIFQTNNIPTVAISGDNIPYLERTWHNYTDRLELLDEKNLDLAFELILKYAEQN